MTDQQTPLGDEFDYTTEDTFPRRPDRWTWRRHWRLIALIVGGFSVVQVLWLAALGVFR